MTSEGLRPIQRAKTPAGMNPQQIPERFELNSEDNWEDVDMPNPNDHEEANAF